MDMNLGALCSLGPQMFRHVQLVQNSSGYESTYWLTKKKEQGFPFEMLVLNSV